MGGLGAIAAGLGGVGEVWIDQAKADREAALRAAEQEREFSFRKQLADQSEAGANTRTQMTIDAENTRAAAQEAGQNTRFEQEQKRLTQGDRFQDANGNWFYGDGSPVVGKDGKQISGPISGKNVPDLQENAAFLVKIGAATDLADAVDQLNSAKNKDTTAADVERMTEDALKTERSGAIGELDAGEADARRAQIRAGILKRLGLTEDDIVKRPRDRGKKVENAPAAAVTQEPTDAPARVAAAKAAITAGADAQEVRRRLFAAGIDADRWGVSAPAASKGDRLGR